MIMTLSLSVIFLITSQYAFADTCSAKLTSYNAPQFYLLSDEVFAGTVQHIDNATDHQWKVYFTVDKIWRGTVGQKPLIVMTNDLQGCGYSIAQGEKYLVYTNGYPPFFNTVWSKPYADAQNDIAIIDDPKFQSDEKAQEDLNKKLVIARDAISNLMGSKMGTIPFNSVGVDVINSTLDIGIDSAKAVLSEEAYEKKIKDIVGDIPIKITFGQIVTDAPILDTLSAKNSVPISLSPLQQFKSGIKAEDVKCKEDFMLVIKASDGSPACVTPHTFDELITRGWGIIPLGGLPTDHNTSIFNTGILSGGVIRGGGPSLDSPVVNYEIDVYANDGITLVGKTFSDANAHYSMQLPAGNYTVYVPDYPDKQKHFVSVFPGKNTIFNIAYGIGYK